MRVIKAERWMRGWNARALAEHLHTTVNNAAQLRRGIDVTPDLASGPPVTIGDNTPTDSEVENGE